MYPKLITQNIPSKPYFQNNCVCVCACFGATQLLIKADEMTVSKMLKDQQLKGRRSVADLDAPAYRYYASGPLGGAAGCGGAGVFAPSGYYAVPAAIRRRLVDHQVT